MVARRARDNRCGRGRAGRGSARSRGRRRAKSRIVPSHRSDRSRIMPRRSAASGREGEAGRRAGLDMLLMIHVEDDAGAAPAPQPTSIGADHRAEGADARLAARADARPRAVGAAQAGEIGALALGPADPDRVGERAERMRVGGGDRLGADRPARREAARRQHRFGRLGARAELAGRTAGAARASRARNRRKDAYGDSGASEAWESAARGTKDRVQPSGDAAEVNRGRSGRGGCGGPCSRPW